MSLRSTKVLVDEVVHVAELKLDGGAHVVEAHNLAVVADDLKAALAGCPEWLFAISSTNNSLKMS